ncbi:ubiquitin thioesterase OTUB1-like, partial [Nematostella vectensis]
TEYLQDTQSKLRQYTSQTKPCTQLEPVATQSLSAQYSHVRRTRGDGNCFFRAFGFSYFEKLLTDEKEYQRFKDLAARSKDELVELNFPAFTIEDFHEVFMEVLDMMGNNATEDQLIQKFQDEGISNYLVVYLRLLTSAQLQRNAVFFENFIEGERTVKEFCNQEVEPMGKESDHIHIIGLTEALGVCIRVEYVDRTGDDVNHHDFPEDGSTPIVHLLYRPGHYDVLYLANQ